MQSMFLTNRKFKQLARWALALFVLALLNVSIQMPVHATMKGMMSISDVGMSHDMPDCQCPPSLCDSVTALDNQILEKPSTSQSAGAQPVLELLDIINTHHLQLSRVLYYERHQLKAKQTALSPHQITSLLLI